MMFYTHTWSLGISFPASDEVVAFFNASAFPFGFARPAFQGRLPTLGGVGRVGLWHPWQKGICTCYYCIFTKIYALIKVNMLSSNWPLSSNYNK